MDLTVNEMIGIAIMTVVGFVIAISIGLVMS